MAEIPKDGRGRVTERCVERLVAEGSGDAAEVVYWHPELSGFGVRVGRRGGSWLVMGRVRLEGEARAKLRKIGLGKVGVVSMEDAMSKGREMLTAMALGRDPRAVDDGRLKTLGDVLKRCRETKGDGYAPEVDRYFGAWMNERMTDISGSRIERRYREIVEEIQARRGTSGLASASTAVRQLSYVWNLARSLDDSLPPNPIPSMRKRRLVKEPKPKTDRIPEDKLGQFWTALFEEPSIVGRDVIAFMLLTGMRRSVACGFRIEWWDSDERMVRVPGSAMKMGRDWEAPVCDAVADLLDRRKAEARNGWMFPSHSKSGHIEEPRYVLDRVGKKLGFHCSVHGLRRTFGSEAAGVMGEVHRKRLMDHAMDGVTEAHYSVTGREALRASVQKLCDRLTGFGGQAGAVGAWIASGAVRAADGSRGQTLQEQRAERMDVAIQDGLHRKQEEFRRLTEGMSEDEVMSLLRSAS